GVDPVQIFQHDHERLQLALSTQQAFDRIQSELAPLRRFEIAKPIVFRQGIEKPEGRRKQTAKTFVESEQGPGGLRANRPHTVAFIYAEQRLEKIDDGQIADGPAMRGSAGVQDPAPDGLLRLNQLMKQPGLTHPWLAHDGNDFAVTTPRAVERDPKLLHLRFASDEATKASEGGGLKPCPRS